LTPYHKTGFESSEEGRRALEMTVAKLLAVQIREMHEAGMDREQAEIVITENLLVIVADIVRLSVVLLSGADEQPSPDEVRAILHAAAAHYIISAGN